MRASGGPAGIHVAPELPGQLAGGATLAVQARKDGPVRAGPSARMPHSSAGLAATTGRCEGPPNTAPESRPWRPCPRAPTHLIHSLCYCLRHRLCEHFHFYLRGGRERRIQREHSEHSAARQPQCTCVRRAATPSRRLVECSGLKMNPCSPDAQTGRQAEAGCARAAGASPGACTTALQGQCTALAAALPPLSLPRAHALPDIWLAPPRGTHAS